MIKSKKGFVFTFLAVFLVLLIYVYAETQIGVDNRELYAQFEENRITDVNREIEYFSSSFLQDSLRISFDSTLHTILNDSRDTRENYSEFNSLVYEGMVDETLEGEGKSSLTNKSIGYLVDQFINSFETRQNAEMNFSLDSVRVFEQSPYSVSLQADYSVDITLQDSLASWNFSDSQIVTIPITGYYEPQHYLFFDSIDKEDVPRIDPVARRTVDDWTLDSFNQTVNEQLISVSTNPNFQYTLGSSFLRTLFNSMEGPYSYTSAFWSFEYEDRIGSLYDTAQQLEDGGTYFSSLIFALSINESGMGDFSGYNQNVVSDNVIFSSQDCISTFCANFSDINARMNISWDESLNISQSDFTISLWADLNYSTEDSQPRTLIQQGEDYSFQLNYTPSSDELKITSRDESGEFFETSVELGSLEDTWTHIAIVKRENSLQLYVNGAFRTQELIQFPETLYDVDDDFLIGHEFDRSLTEIGLYSRVINAQELSLLYNLRGIINLDYRTTAHGEGISFMDENHFAVLELGDSINNSFFVEPFTLEFWFLPTSSSGDVLSIDDELNFSYENVSVSETEFIISGERTSSFSLDYSYPVFVTLSYDGSDLSVYKNKDLIGEIPLSFDIAEESQIEIAQPISNGVNSSFLGVLDEIRLLSQETTHNEVIKRYYNYGSEAKGCCNYISLINPDATGFNTSAYNESVSYSTGIFYREHFENSIDNDEYSLLNLTRVTGSSPGEKHYNFLFDACMAHYFNIPYETASLNYVREHPIYRGDAEECEFLIREGLY